LKFPLADFQWCFFLCLAALGCDEGCFCRAVNCGAVVSAKEANSLISSRLRQRTGYVHFGLEDDIRDNDETIVRPKMRRNAKATIFEKKISAHFFAAEKRIVGQKAV
jgi:hypothetical protein